MDIIEKACIIKFHRDKIARFSGYAPEAVGWKNKEAQLKRFEILAEIGNLDSCSVMDLGCGYGDLKSFLDARFSNFEYIGIDCVSEYIDAAKKRFQGRINTHFFQHDFSKILFPEVDYIIASGAMAYRTKNLVYYFNLIEQMYAASRKAVAFNMLDKDNFKSEGVLVAHDSEEVKEYCSNIADRVVLKKGYLKNDFTIFMYKNQHN